MADLDNVTMDEIIEELHKRTDAFILAFLIDQTDKTYSMRRSHGGTHPAAIGLCNLMHAHLVEDFERVEREGFTD